MLKRIIAITFLLPLAAAHADDHDGLGVGPRREGWASGAGIELRRRDTTFELFAGAYGARSPSWKSGGLAASFGVSQVVASHGRAELSLGARVGIQRARQSQVGATSTYRQLSAQLPLRLTVWVTDHLAVNTELGLEVTRTHTTSEWYDPALDATTKYDDTTDGVGLFGDPLMNLGLTYVF